MLKGTRSPLPRRSPRRLSASVWFGAQRLHPKAGRGTGGIPTCLSAGAERTASVAFGSLNLMGDRHTPPVTPAAAEGTTLAPQRPLRAACAAQSCALPRYSPPGASCTPRLGGGQMRSDDSKLHPFRSAALLQIARRSASGQPAGCRRTGEEGSPRRSGRSFPSL